MGRSELCERIGKMNGKDFIRVFGAFCGVGLVFLMFAAAGCESSSRSGESGLFGDEHLVAAGYDINWEAKENGTAYLVEETTNKVLKTESMEAGMRFSFTVAGIDGEAQFEALFGVKFSDAAFRLYFIPEGQELLK